VECARPLPLPVPQRHTHPLTRFAGVPSLPSPQFNAGSALSAGHLAGRALVNTQLAAAMAMFTWSLLEVVVTGEEGYFKGRPTSVGAASGAIVGLVAITPACGYVLPMGAFFIGAFTTLVVFLSLRAIKRFSGVEDTLDVFGFHGIAGMVGTALTGLFASKKALSPSDGAFYGDGGVLFGKQLAAVSATILLCAVGTTAIFWFLRAISLLLRTDMRIPDEHKDNVDASQHGEKAYFRHVAAAAAQQYNAAASEGTRPAAPSETRQGEAPAAEGKRAAKAKERAAQAAAAAEAAEPDAAPAGGVPAAAEAV
jgi:hypothetical protein